MPQKYRGKINRKNNSLFKSRYVIPKIERQMKECSTRGATTLLTAVHVATCNHTVATRS